MMTKQIKKNERLDEAIGLLDYFKVKELMTPELTIKTVNFSN